ncbi:hypothetical protein [Bradyrhizobium sp. I71]|uniref:hypothetical protein n=1 Tax=Bradyrhizobium sp. I71 TaxID=2590772 RepID=UPI001EF9A3A8|nr:hypothetical protein [Bradyrhizobium sp. I71]ULK97073.1 hypothetical protein FJV43_30875 [Bradyrhizobium sp. I71]
MALEGRGFRGKLAEVECGARIGVSFGLTGSLIFECCGASRFAVQQGLALQEILPQPTRTIASADDRDADPRTYDFRDGTAERNAPRTKSRSTPDQPPVA